MTNLLTVSFNTILKFKGSGDEHYSLHITEYEDSSGVITDHYNQIQLSKKHQRETSKTSKHLQCKENFDFNLLSNSNQINGNNPHFLNSKFQESLLHTKQQSTIENIKNDQIMNSNMSIPSRLSTYENSFQNFQIQGQIDFFQENFPEITPFVSPVNFIKQYTYDDLEEIYSLERSILEEENYLNSLMNPSFKNNQQFIQPYMRIILLDWMMEVSSQMSFKRATYHSAVTYLDLFLSLAQNLPTNSLQLLGVTCLIIAAKNEVFKF
jgi:hypothetical protein